MTSAAGDDLFVLPGGRRSRLRNRAIILALVSGIAIAVLVNALHQPKGDNNGSVGHLVVPAAVAFACLGALIVTLNQWWEDDAFFAAHGDRLGVRHGTRAGRGRVTWFVRTGPIVISIEGAGSSQAIFAEQPGARLRLGDSASVSPLQLAHLEGWIRGHGFAVERR